MELNNFFNAYKSDLTKALSNINLEYLEDLISLVSNSIENKRQIFLLGNGGSSANPSHSAGDWSKELDARAICLTDNVSSLTAWANDTDYSNVFLAQLKVFMDTNDLIIAYSGSGNSTNVINAIKWANDNGGITFGITGNYKGKGGGTLASISQHSIIFETESMEVIEDLQLITNHIVKEYIKKRT